MGVLLTNGSATTGNVTATNATSPALCELSPHARAFSSVLTAFIGSIVTGVCGGHFAAFYAAWICWLATVRILFVGIWASIEALRGNSLKGGDQFHRFCIRIPLIGRLAGTIEEFDDPFFQPVDETEPTVLGWLGWFWSVAYAPVIQTLWLIKNWSEAAGSVKIVRALGVSVMALPLTIDTRARYGAALGNRIGSWSEKVFNVVTAVSCLVLGGIASIELVLGAIEAPVKPFVTVIYVLAMLLWTYVSLVFATPHDGGRSTFNVLTVLGGLAMRIFGGLFTAWPAFILIQKAPQTPGTNLGAYIKCESVPLWQKVVSVLP